MGSASVLLCSVLTLIFPNLLLGFLLSSHEGDTPVVQTTCGPVVGVNSSDVNVFKGIPYALPPVGKLRWQPPVAPSHDTNTCWSGIYRATDFKSHCFQPAFGNYSSFSGSEDCLYLNIWTPSLDPKANLPVMIWIHGGFLIFSSGNWPGYMPTESLTRDTNVVYVSMNYRLNALGFMALDLLSEETENKTSGNYGFRDQILAMEWIRNNIKHFGGDPGKMTVFGQSSGGTSIFALLASPMAKNLFQRAWLMSASPVLNKTLEEASRDNLVFLKNTGCSDVDCLRALTPAQVLTAVPWYQYPFWGMADQGDLPVKNAFDGAVAIVDGEVLPKSPFEAWRDKEGNDVPTVIGTTAQELDFMPSPPNLTSWTWENYTYHVHKKLDTFSLGVANAALNMYPPSTKYTPVFAFTSLGSDIRVTCPNDVMGTRAAESFISPVWRYVVTSWPSAPVHPLSFPFPSKYSFHMWDCIAYMGDIPYYIKEPSALDKAFQDVMRDEILSFVRDGRVSTSSWKPFPSSTAVINASTEINSGFNTEFCEYWIKNNFFSYAWIN